MIKHLPFNEFDMAGITTSVNRYKSAGLAADYDVGDKSNGVVRILFLNPVLRDGSIVIFEVHKIARPGWLREKAWWVVQLWSQAPNELPQKRGCVSDKTQAHALHEAELDLQFNFMSICDFELAATGYD